MTHRPRPFVDRLFAAGFVGGAVLVAGTWVDDPPDSTCGSVWRTDLWMDRDDCVGSVAIRIVVALVLLGIAVLLVVRSFRTTTTRSE